VRRAAIRAVFVFGLVLTALLSGCATPAPPADPLAVLLNLIDQRLAISEEVARSKWNSGAPVEDLAREREIVAAIGRQANAYGIEPAFAETFFRAQIEASKVVQHARIAQWRAARQAPFTDAPDLQRDIRPQLDRLTMELLTALAQAMPALRTPGAGARLTAHANTAARAAALAPLRQTPPN
jgi:chorismate mutase